MLVTRHPPASLIAGPLIAASNAAGMPSVSEGNAQLASGACAMALPASAPARMGATNGDRSICRENVDIEHRPFLSGTDRGYISLQTSTHVAPVSWANRVSGIRIAA